MSVVKKLQLKTPKSPFKKQIKKNEGRADEPRTLVPDGFYEAVAVDCFTQPMFGGEKAFLKLSLIELVDKPSEVKSVFMACVVHDKFKPRSKMYKLWCMVHERLPRKGQKISIKDLLGHVYKIKTRTVKRNEHQKDHIPIMWYSMAEIEEVLVRNHKPLTTNQKPLTNNQLSPNKGFPPKGV